MKRKKGQKYFRLMRSRGCTKSGATALLISAPILLGIPWNIQASTPRVQISRLISETRRNLKWIVGAIAMAAILILGVMLISSTAAATILKLTSRNGSGSRLLLPAWQVMAQLLG